MQPAFISAGAASADYRFASISMTPRTDGINTATVLRRQLAGASRDGWRTARHSLTASIGRHYGDYIPIPMTSLALKT